MSRLKPAELKIEDWLKLAAKPAIQKGMRDSAYARVYPTLLIHFKGLPKIDWDAAILGLHIVYGWMPTIPKLEIPTGWPRAKRDALCALLTAVKAEKVPDECEMGFLAEFTGKNSVVGASKLIHFLNPKKCPIWDTRVAQSFLWKGACYGTVNKAARWVDYQSTVENWTKDKEVKSRCGTMRKKAKFLRDVSDLRMVELVMFLDADPNASANDR